MKQMLFLSTVLLLVTTALAEDAKISVEEAMNISLAFTKNGGTKGKLSFKSCGPYSNSGAPNEKGWYVKFARQMDTEFTMKLDEFGKVDWFERSGNGPQTKFKTSKDWQIKAIQRGRSFLQSIGVKEPLGEPPLYPEFMSSRSFHFPILVNGLRFVGDWIGYSITYEGPDMDFVRFSRNVKVPTVNTARSSITPEQALEEANRALPTDKDFGQRYETRKYVFGKPSSMYYYRQGEVDKGILVWYMTVDASTYHQFSVKGTRYGIVVDATTGKFIKTKNMLSAFL